MNKLLTITITILLCFALGNTVSAQSCCKKPEGMQALALNADFRAAHAAPLPLNYAAHDGKMIAFPVKGDKPGHAFYVESDEPSDKVLLIFHEWWGVNEYMQREAETWATMLDHKVNVYVVDLFDGKVAKDAETAAKLSGGMNAKRGDALIKGVLAAAGPKIKHIATLGWCFGGSWAFTAAVLAGNKADACVMYYGFPEKDISRIKHLNCDVLYIRATQDNFIKESDVDEFAGKVKMTGHNIDIKSYDAVHAFANPSNPKHDVAAATDAQRHAEEFIKGKLKMDITVAPK